MTELKTLKHIQPKGIRENGTITYGGYIPIRKLRLAAIEWIKSLRKELENCVRDDGASSHHFDIEPEYICSNMLYESIDSTDITGTIKWIKYFFDISEEDLN